jgi:hypothetical protein
MLRNVKAAGYSRAAMTPQEAERALEDTEVVELVEGTLARVKELAQAALEADIPVLLGRPPGKT